MTIKTDAEQVDWQAVSELLKHFGLSSDDAILQEQIFHNSYGVVFIYDHERLVGCGRVISDGFRQAAIYNIALYEEYQGSGMGRAIIQTLLDQVKGCTVSLYTHPKTVALYERFGFRRQKTGMVLINRPEEELSWMEDEGFLLPKEFRFQDNSYERGEDLS